MSRLHVPRRPASLLGPLVRLLLGSGLAACLPEMEDTAEVASVTSSSSNDSEECQRLPADERRDALLALNDEQRNCANGDDDCPCGSYCNGLTALCQVDCITDEPPEEYVCSDGFECTPLGRCEASAEEPPPSVQALTLAMSPAGISANTSAGARLVPVTVSVTANSLDFRRPDHPATVCYRIQTTPPLPGQEMGLSADPEIDHVSLEEAELEPGPVPRVKCASDAPLAAFCDLQGGWVFHVGSGVLISDPRTIWVEIPQTDADADWTLEARSDWATTPATMAVQAESIVIPSTDPGTYVGAMLVPNQGDPDDEPLSVPVEAVVTSDHIAVFEPTRVMFPEGYVVVPREWSEERTYLRWLSSGVGDYPHLEVGLQSAWYEYPEVPYDPETGELSFGFWLDTPHRPADIDVPRELPRIGLELQRTGDVPPSCPSSGSCAIGTHCNPVMNLCLPGAGPPEGQRIAPPSGALMSSFVTSAMSAPWWGPLGTVAEANSTQLEPGLVSAMSGLGMDERAYCYQSSQQQGPATLSAALQDPSKDRGCRVANAPEGPQLTFPYANRQHQVFTDQGQTINLLDTCLAELRAQPSGPATAANLLGTRKCVSLGRFFLGLMGQTSSHPGQLLHVQMLRQWLGLTAFVASTSVQDQAFDDALGAEQANAATRFGSVLDATAANLEFLFDTEVAWYGVGISTAAVAAPDYRAIPRPLVRWSFNSAQAPSPDAEAEPGAGVPLVVQGQPVRLTGGELVASGQDPGSAGNRCESAHPVMAAGGNPYNQYFTISFKVTSTDVWTGSPTTLLQKEGSNGDWLKVTARSTAGANDQVTIALVSSTGGSVTFPAIPRDAQGSLGMVAIVNESGGYTLWQARPGQGVQRFKAPSGSVVNGGVRWGAAGIVTLKCGQARDGLWIVDPIRWDEVSLWRRALVGDEVAAMAARYAFNPQNESVPPRDAPPLSGKEQAAGLPVYLLEAASADLRLTDAYIGAERNQIYGDCLAGRTAALERTRDRAGRHLRIAELVRQLAAMLAGSPGATAAAWYPRYQADAQELAGWRAKVFANLVSASDCKNPLGIEEGDLPLYVGAPGGSAAERFFAGSRFLAAQALVEEGAAAAQLESARQQYHAGQMSAFQESEAQHDAEARVRNLSIEAESLLEKLCGAQVGDGSEFPLLDGFLDGTIDAGNCYLKLDRPECAAAEILPVRDVPTSCLGGQIGERLLAVKAAAVDSENATRAVDRAIDQYNADMGYCGALQRKLEQDEELLRKHHQHMRELRESKSRWASSFALVGYLVGLATKSTVEDAAANILAMMAAADASGWDESIARESAAYEATMLARANRQEVMACTHKAESLKFAIDAGRDTVRRGIVTVHAAMVGLADDHAAVASLANRVAAQLTLETRIDRTPPHLHYWLGQAISSYQVHMAHARRLTYLAVRAFEYESQQDADALRADVVEAQVPSDLTSVISHITLATAPYAGTRAISEGPLALSLRDDILRIADLSANSTRLDGTAPLTPIEAFRELLTSDAAKVYDRSGAFVGRGIRFSLRPDEGTANSCVERLSRIMPDVQFDLARDISEPKLVLAAANTFGSQVCGAPAGTLEMARIRPSNALLIGGSSTDLPEPRPFQTTNIVPLLNVSQPALRQYVFPTNDPSAFAGRGRYGDYILIFPASSQPCGPTLCAGWSIDVLEHVTDVLIRLDTVEQNNTDL